MAVDTIKHKKLVLDNCLLLADHLIGRGQVELGTQLLKRGCEHDNSKFDTEEFRQLSNILKDRKCFIDARAQLSQDEINAIKYHWSHNRHHPEYFNNSDEMEEIDIIEMVCDWFARSIQYKTDFIPFVKERQENRFKFSEGQFDIIMYYCLLIEKLYNNNIIKSQFGFVFPEGRV